MKILFLTQGNKDVGLGHHRRTTALAQEASSRGHATLILTDLAPEANAVRWWRWSAWDRFTVDKAWTEFRPDWVVADVPGTVPEWALTFRRLLLVDHFDGRATCVSQGFGGSEHQAPDYVIIPHEIKVFKRGTKPDRPCWFVWGGAADAEGLLKRFARTVPDAALLVAAKGVTPEPDLMMIDHYLVHAPDRGQFLRWLSECDRAAIQMGQTVWEAIYLGRPCWVFSHDGRGLETALGLHERGWALAFPRVGLPTGRIFSKFLARPFELHERPVDGHGARRIVELMERG